MVIQLNSFMPNQVLSRKQGLEVLIKGVQLFFGSLNVAKVFPDSEQWYPSVQLHARILGCLRLDSEDEVRAALVQVGKRTRRSWSVCRLLKAHACAK